MEDVQRYVTWEELCLRFGYPRQGPTMDGKCGAIWDFYDDETGDYATIYDLGTIWRIGGPDPESVEFVRRLFNSNLIRAEAADIEERSRQVAKSREI